MPNEQQSLSRSVFPPKSTWVGNLALGDEVFDLFILSVAQQKQARNGSYWFLEFQDASGNINGKIWSPQSQAYTNLTPGMAVRVKGRVTSYRNSLELAVNSLEVLGEQEKDSLDIACFMPSSTHDPEAMLAELRELAQKTLAHTPLRKLVLSLLTDEKIVPELRVAPAAKSMHHAYAGGLLEHTLSVARLCLALADHYPHLDRQILFAGAVFHDLGKLWEFSTGFSVEYTTSGRLLGHINLLLDRLTPFIKKSGLEPELVEHLQHLVLSHHGTLEFGSSRLPATAEALALHYADNLDAKLQQVSSALEGVEQGGWSTYNSGLERFLYRTAQTPTPGEAMRQAHCNVKVADKEACEAEHNASAITKNDDSAPFFKQCSLLSKG